MKQRLMEIIRCPLSQGPLKLVALETTEEQVPETVAEPACRVSCYRHSRAVSDGAPEGGWQCRRCHGEEVVEGLLVSEDSENVYPIIEGAPRLIPKALEAYPAFFHAHRSEIEQHLSKEKVARLVATLPSPTDARSPESFGLQWKEYQFEDLTWFKDLELRRGEFLHSMNLPADALPGTTLLDGGCGHGALTAILATYGLEAFGMDFTRAVGRAQGSREKFAKDRAPFVHYFQGDLLQPPLAPDYFDNTHCSGVIHHTPLPLTAFKTLENATRPGGRLYIQVYRKREPIIGIPNAILRAITTRIPLKLLWKICWTLAPLHAFLVRMVAKMRGEKSLIDDTTRREQTVSLFDNYSPRYQFRYHDHELRKIFQDEGMTKIEDTTLENEARHMVAFVGVKPGGAPTDASPKPSSPQATTSRSASPR